MPIETRHAMKTAIAVNPIIVGAYTDRDGGICPMLAAHRNGGRTSFASFAHAWDRYTRATGAPRRASEREVRALTTMLEASIALEAVNGSGALGAAITEHQQVRAQRARREEHAAVASQARPATAKAGADAPVAPEVPSPATMPAGDCDRSAELSGRPGWAWLRPFRRLDEYERALEQLRALEQAGEPAAPTQPHEREHQPA